MAERVKARRRGRAWLVIFVMSLEVVRHIEGGNKNTRAKTTAPPRDGHNPIDLTPRSGLTTTPTPTPTHHTRHPTPDTPHPTPQNKALLHPRLKQQNNQTQNHAVTVQQL